MPGKIGNTFGLISNLVFPIGSLQLGLRALRGEVMPAGTIAAFWVVSLMFVVTPGADWAYAIAAGLRYRSVVPAVGGLLVGHLAATVVVAAGVAALLARLAAGDDRADGGRRRVPGVAGHRHAGPPVDPAGRQANSRRLWLRQAAKGAGISGLNPKVFLLFLALLPHFTDPGAPWPIGAQIMLLGLVHVANCAVVYTGVGVGSRTVLRTLALSCPGCEPGVRRGHDHDRGRVGG